MLFFNVVNNMCCVMDPSDLARAKGGLRLVTAQSLVCVMKHDLRLCIVYGREKLNCARLLLTPAAW